MKKLFIAVLFLCVFALYVVPAHAVVLWDNGSESWGKALSNEINTNLAYSRVYDDFFVPEADGTWRVEDVWAYNYFTDNEGRPTTTQANWEIRSGVSEGVGGTLVANGISAATETYSSEDLYVAASKSYKIMVSGLNVILNPGQYWLAVTPIGYGPGQGQSFIQYTSGENGVGNSLANDGNAYWTTPSFGGHSFELQDYAYDFSMGIAGERVPAEQGNPVPEPATLLLLGSGLVGLFVSKKYKA